MVPLLIVACPDAGLAAPAAAISAALKMEKRNRFMDSPPSREWNCTNHRRAALVCGTVDGPFRGGRQLQSERHVSAKSSNSGRGSPKNCDGTGWTDEEGRQANLACRPVGFPTFPPRPSGL